ncbi:MAG TPA: tetratricopeptide repeat protein [Verrucomicrobiae bacterium]
MKRFFGGLFGRKPAVSEAVAVSPSQVKPLPPPRRRATTTGYDKGDFISERYEVQGTLGKGGFGVVYQVYGHETRQAGAVKTFRDELVNDPAVRDAFKNEALLWLNLGAHPFVVAARFVFEVEGRLFVEMELVTRDEFGRVSLADHLKHAQGPIAIGQTLTWAVQFCLGMEHARTRGITCHRDIKPGNILIRDDGILKISDFGLATAANFAWQQMSVRGGSLLGQRAGAGGGRGEYGFSFMQAGAKGWCGTPGYLAPEVYRGEGADIRSDIFSFGVVLWQMAAGSVTLPHVPSQRVNGGEFLRLIYEQQMMGRWPTVAGPLAPVIARCLHPNPAERWQDFRQLRAALEPMLKQATGTTIEIPAVQEHTAAFWCNRGASLAALNRPGEAITCCDRALALNSQFVEAWYHKGISLSHLDRHPHALASYDRALVLDPRHKRALGKKAGSHYQLGEFQDALDACDQALAIDPNFEVALLYRGLALGRLGRWEEAIASYERALLLKPQDNMIRNSIGSYLSALGRHQEAMKYYDQILADDPGSRHGWIGKVAALVGLGQHRDAMAVCERILATDPRDRNVHFYRGISLAALGKKQAAVVAYRQAVAIDPKRVSAWFNLGALLSLLGQPKEALACYDQVVAMDSQDAAAWFNRGVILEKMRHTQQAVLNYRKCIEVAPANADLRAKAQRKLEKLEG